MEQAKAGEINTGEISKKVDELDAVDPETLVELDENVDSGSDGPATEVFENFVVDIDTEPVRSEETDDAPIDATMDELFAE